MLRSTWVPLTSPLTYRLSLSYQDDRPGCLQFLLFSSGQTAVKLSGAEAADRAQCAAPDQQSAIDNADERMQALSASISVSCY